PSFQSLHTCTSSLCPVPSPPPAPPSPYTTLFRSTVVLGPASAVLVGHRAPSPIGHRLCGLRAQECVRIDLHRVHGAQMLPLVAEVECETEVLAGADGPGDLHACEIEYLLQCAEGRIAHSRAVELIGDDAPVVQGEHRQMSQVPPGEGQIDRLGEVCECVRRAEREGSPRARPQTLTAPSEQFD